MGEEGEGEEGRTDVTGEGGGVVDAATELILFDQVTVGLLKTLQTQIPACCSASVAHQSEDERHSLDILLSQARLSPVVFQQIKPPKTRWWLGCGVRALQSHRYQQLKSLPPILLSSLPTIRPSFLPSFAKVALSQLLWSTSLPLKDATLAGPLAQI